MNTKTGNMLFMQVGLWIPAGRDHADPKRCIIARIKGSGQIDNIFEAYKELDDLIDKYEERTNRIVCYDKNGSLYFAANDEELAEFLARVRSSERTIAAGKLAENKKYEDSGFWPDPQLVHEDRTKTMLRDHSLAIPRHSTLERMTKNQKDLEAQCEEMKARIEALERMIEKLTDPK